jgi:D-alanine--D-alanine ligase
METNFRKKVPRPVRNREGLQRVPSSNGMKIALLCGGPSLERGISLNSARSVLDHLEGDNIEILPIFFDHKKRAYKISKAQLYSNNPSDFDFKLSEHSAPLSQSSLIKLLKSADIVFPVMHGPFGEDGQIQAFLEKNNIPFIGSGFKACKMAFDKYEANNTIKEKGFYTLPSALLKIYSKDQSKIIKDFFIKHKLKRAIVKPATGGSSIGVFSVNTALEAIDKVNLLFSKRMDTRVVLEPFAKGVEFTVIILQNKLGLPVAVIPTEIETAYKEGRIFDFRKKYLPTNQVKYHCPPRFPKETIEKIQTEAKQLFALFGMNDFARFDGWVLPNGKIWFSDFNPVSGMEQNSFLFQQASRLGMSHSDLLHYIVRNSCQRQNINFPEVQKKNNQKRKPVSVIFGGHTSERQVSLMSGTNVWLKLRNSKIYEPKPYLLDFENNVWELPYTLILNHTVEEIIENAKNAEKGWEKTKNMISRISSELMLGDGEATEQFFMPKKIRLPEFVKKSDFVFLGLHGGDGENGNFQRLLSKAKIKFNGSGEKTSHLCMDKFATGEFIRASDIKGVSIAPQKVFFLRGVQNEKKLWQSLTRELGAKTLIVKPKDDGCSTGVAHLYTEDDLKNYLSYLQKRKVFIPAGILKNQDSIIEMPNTSIHEILFEKFIETDNVKIKQGKLKYIRRSGWVEVTIGILEEREKPRRKVGVPTKASGLKAFNPSVTIAEGEVLSLEEKFQGGTGVNLTPPPKEIAKANAVTKAKSFAEKIAGKIGIAGYARLDAFMNVSTGALSVIEVNTLPGLTPSTVLYQQALAEKNPIFPRDLLERIIKNSGY